MFMWSNDCDVKEMSVRENYFSFKGHQGSSDNPRLNKPRCNGFFYRKKDSFTIQPIWEFDIALFTVFIILFYDSQDKSKVQDVQNNRFVNTGILLNWLILAFWILLVYSKPYPSL